MQEQLDLTRGRTEDMPIHVSPHSACARRHGPSVKTKPGTEEKAKYVRYAGTRARTGGDDKYLRSCAAPAARHGTRARSQSISTDPYTGRM